MLLDVLRAHGHEGVHAHQLGEDRASDSELLATARRESRVVITADLDFPRLLALVQADGPGIILFRGGNYSDREMCALLERVLSEVAPQVWAVREPQPVGCSTRHINKRENHESCRRVRIPVGEHRRRRPRDRGRHRTGSARSCRSTAD